MEHPGLKTATILDASTTGSSFTHYGTVSAFFWLFISNPSAIILRSKIYNYLKYLSVCHKIHIHFLLHIFLILATLNYTLWFVFFLISAGERERQIHSPNTCNGQGWAVPGMTLGARNTIQLSHRVAEIQMTWTITALPQGLHQKQAAVRSWRQVLNPDTPSWYAGVLADVLAPRLSIHSRYWNNVTVLPMVSN